MRNPQYEPAALPRTHISRPRLLHKLSLATQCKLTIVCANAGYGKTTLLTEFVRAAGLLTEWYYLTPADRDITRLTEGLETCLRRLAPGPEPKVNKRTRARQSGTPATAALAEVLLKQASRVGPEPALLVLDDYHNVDGAGDINPLLGSFIENSPRCLRFVLLSRSVPHLPLTKLRARQESSVLEETALAFTLEETSRFLRVESGLDLDATAIALVHERTEGWAAGIAMVAQSLRYGNQEKVMAVLADPVASAWLVYDYLAEEVFDRQDPAIQDFLIKTSVLGKMSAAACDYLLDSTSSQGTLVSLEERGLFTTSEDPSKQSFRYHHLFIEFLRQKLYQRERRESVENLHLKAAQYYEREDEWEDCVHHYLKAEEPVRAARVVETIGERYIFSGFSQTVDHWLRALPEDVTATRPWLLALRGRLSNMSARYDDALRLLERALRLFRANEDEDGQAWTIGEIAYVRFRFGQLRQSIRDFSSALSIAKAGSVLRNQLLIMQAMAYRDAGMLEDSVRACTASLDELAAVEDEAKRLWGQSRIARNLALAQMEMGCLDVALRSAREALASCVAHQIGEHEESWVLASLGAILWATGDFEEAIKVFDRARSLYSRHTGNLQQFIAPWLGNSLRDSGRFAEAEQAYGHSSGQAELELIFAALLSNRHSKTVRAQTVDLYRRYHVSDSIVVKSTAEVVFAAVLWQGQEVPRAYEHIREAVRLLKASGHRMRLASALLHQARIEHDLSRPSEARESLAQALQIANTDGYYHFFWWDPEMVAFLCQRALSESLFADYVTELATRRLDSTSAAALAPLLQHKRTDVRQRAQRILTGLPQRGATTVREEILADCSDLRIRESLLHTLAEGVISLQGVQILRSKHALSWREIEILVEYYLRPAAGPALTSAHMRRECAERLSISEYTVRCHVNNLRGKLALPAWVSGRRVLDWAQQEGLLSEANPQQPAGSEPRDSPAATK